MPAYAYAYALHRSLLYAEKKIEGRTDGATERSTVRRTGTLIASIPQKMRCSFVSIKIEFHKSIGRYRNFP